MPSLHVLVQRLGDQRVVPCFHCTLLLDMPPSEASGSPSGARAQFFPDDIGLAPNLDRLGTPISPTIRFRWVSHFAALPRFAYAAAYRVVHPLGGSDQGFTRPQGFLRPSFRTSRSPSSSSGIATVVSEHFHRWFFQPLERQLASLHRDCGSSPSSTGPLPASGRARVGPPGS